MIDDVRSRRRDWTRTQILAAAWELVARDGIAALSLRELAAKVGMRAPSLYTYFPAKSDLHDAMYAQGMQQFAERMRSVPRGPDAVETLHELARTFVATSVADRFRFELLFQRPIPGFVPSPQSLAVGLSTLEVTREVAAAAGLRGERAFDLFMATIRGLVSMQIANDPGGDRWVRLVEESVDVLVAHYAPAVPPAKKSATRRGSRPSSSTSGRTRK